MKKSEFFKLFEHLTDDDEILLRGDGGSVKGYYLREPKIQTSSVENPSYIGRNVGHPDLANRLVTSENFAVLE